MNHLVVLGVALALLATVAAAEVEDPNAVHAVIVGRAADPRVGALVKAAHSVARSDLVVTVYDLEAPPRTNIPASLAAKLANARVGDVAVAYVCTDAQCSLPVSDPGRLRVVIRDFPRPQ